MTCCACRAQCPTSGSGLCRGCREDRHKPKQGRSVRVKAARRWTQGENEVLLIRYKLTERQAIDRSMVALAQMDKLFERSVIYTNGLDNPYMEDHARKALAGYVMAARIGRGKRKPVAAARAVSATRKKAA